MHKTARQIIFYTTLSCSLLLMSVPVHAEFYKYVSASGNVLFTDKPVKGSYKLLWKKDQIFTANIAPTWSKKPVKKQLAGRVWKNKIHMEKSKAKAIQPRLDVKSMYKNKARYGDLIDDIARKTRLYPELLHAVVKAESAYDPNAVSHAGAVGLMQLMPQTASRYGVVERRDPKSNLEGGARYLRELLTMYNNNIKLALAAYNAGERAVEKYGNSIPPYPETQNYVKKVLAFFKENRKQLALVN